MARVTVEDCIDKIPNRYELLMVAAQRAKDISAGSPITLPRDNDKTRSLPSAKLPKKLSALKNCKNLWLWGCKNM